MKVAVLGSSGYLGSYIVNNIQNCTVYPITRDTIDLTNVDQVRNFLISTTPDVIVNCATSGGKTKMGENNFLDIQNNLSVFLSFYNSSDLVPKFINVGSGAEFDISKNIDLCKEESILESFPKESYGYSKNIISRLCLAKENFFTLRLFGCFDKSEPDFRLFKKLLRGQITSIIDRQFDFFSASDFVRVLELYIFENQLPQDINCVYQKKYMLSETLHKFNKEFIVEGINANNYTGDSTKLDSLNIELEGLESGINKYINV
jgi:nucleoside-diphosphate-sugar epimerase